MKVKFWFGRIDPIELHDGISAYKQKILKNINYKLVVNGPYFEFDFTPAVGMIIQLPDYGKQFNLTPKEVGYLFEYGRYWELIEIMIRPDELLIMLKPYGE